MGFARHFAQQLARPQGAAGRLLGAAMDVANRTPTLLAVGLLKPQAGESVLDAGCGTGAALAEVLACAPCRAKGIDLSETMVRAARRRLGRSADIRLSGIEDLPFPEASFDAVLALNVLYFSDDDGRMANALWRALRPGGRLVAYVTHRETMEGWPFTREGLHRLFDEAALADALCAGGFARTAISVHERPVARSVRGLFVCAVR